VLHLLEQIADLLVLAAQQGSGFHVAIPPAFCKITADATQTSRAVESAV
jgi:hypothetical protein